MLRSYKIFMSIDLRPNSEIYVLSQLEPKAVEEVCTVTALEMESMAIMTHRCDYFIADNQTIAKVLELVDGCIISKPLLPNHTIPIDHVALTDVHQQHELFDDRYYEVADQIRWAITKVFNDGVADPNSAVGQSILEGLGENSYQAGIVSVAGQYALWEAV